MNCHETKSKQTLATVCEANKELDLVFFPASINGKSAKCLRDTGCTTIIVDEKWVDDNY